MSDYTIEALGAIVKHLETTAIETGAKVDSLAIIMARVETVVTLREESRITRETATDKKLDTIFRMVDGITINTASKKSVDDHECRLRKIEQEDGDKWKKAVWIVVSFLIGGGLVYLSQITKAVAP